MRSWWLFRFMWWSHDFSTGFEFGTKSKYRFTVSFMKVHKEYGGW